MTKEDKLAEELLQKIHNFMDEIGFSHDYENNESVAWEGKYNEHDFLNSLDSVEADLRYFLRKGDD